MAYTIHGLAKACDCETFNAVGLAELWHYWYICNYGSRKYIIAGFNRLRKTDRKKMLDFLRSELPQIYDYIISNLY